jgi:methylated-DNA-[protein]-cysteine S-methyltransferase
MNTNFFYFKELKPFSLSIKLQLNFSSIGLKRINFINVGEHDKFDIIENCHPNNDLYLNQFEKCKTQLDEYFNGQRNYFDIKIDLDLDSDGNDQTPFRKNVWKNINLIPYGETRTYKDISLLINSPKSYRAVGTSAGKNPIPIIIPCHRVVGLSSKVGGYLGGMDLKNYLLQLEKNWHQELKVGTI